MYPILYPYKKGVFTDRMTIDRSNHVDGKPIAAFVTPRGLT